MTIVVNEEKYRGNLTKAQTNAYLNLDKEDRNQINNGSEEIFSHKMIAKSLRQQRP